MKTQWWVRLWNGSEWQTIGHGHNSPILADEWRRRENFSRPTEIVPIERHLELPLPMDEATLHRAG